MRDISLISFFFLPFYLLIFDFGCGIGGDVCYEGAGDVTI